MKLTKDFIYFLWIVSDSSFCADCGRNFLFQIAINEPNFYFVPLLNLFIFTLMYKAIAFSCVRWYVVVF